MKRWEDKIKRKDLNIKQKIGHIIFNNIKP